MIKIRNKELNVSVDSIIDRLKDFLFERYEDIYFKDMKDVGEDIMLTCPFHSNHNERKPSFGIRKSDGMCHCFTCGFAGTISQMISKILNVEDEVGEKWLLDNFYDNIFETRDDLELNLSRLNEIKKNNFITEDELDKYRYYHNYMWKRKLTKEIVNYFDVGYDKDTKCITFPVNDINGNCLFIARRSVNTKMFLLPKNINKPVYGLDKVIKNNNSEVIICESIFNALTCYIYGNIPGVALFGTGSNYQYEILKKCNIRHFILGFDGDEAGDKGREKFYNNLKDFAFISYLKIPRGKDINDLTQEEFKNLEKIPMNF